MTLPLEKEKDLLIKHQQETLIKAGNSVDRIVSSVENLGGGHLRISRMLRKKEVGMPLLQAVVSFVAGMIVAILIVMILH